MAIAGAAIVKLEVACALYVLFLGLYQGHCLDWDRGTCLNCSKQFHVVQTNPLHTMPLL